MLLAMDEAIGVVMAKLKSTGQEKDTLVTFISDNGGPTMVGVTVNGSRNEPLRGSKRTTLEGGVRVPFVVSWPGKIKPAQYDSPVIQLDLHATALAAAGLAEKPEWKLEGVNLLPYLSGEKTGVPHEALYWRFGNQNAIRVGDYKLVTYDAAAEGKTGGKNVIGPRLYNLAKDIHEDNDISKSMPEKVNELQAKWNAWDKLNVKPKWGAETKAGGGKAKKKKGSDD